MKNQISIAATILALAGDRGTRPQIRHSRESGNPGEVERGQYAAAPLHHPWIPAFAGMTEGVRGMTEGGFRVSVRGVGAYFAPNMEFRHGLESGNDGEGAESCYCSLEYPKISKCSATHQILTRACRQRVPVSL